MELAIAADVKLFDPEPYEFVTVNISKAANWTIIEL